MEKTENKTFQEKREEFLTIPRDPLIYKFYTENDLTNLQYYYHNTMPNDNKEVILTNALVNTLIYKFLREREDEDYHDYALIKWLALLPEVNVHVDNDFVFRFLCTYGILSLAKWFEKHFDIDIHAEEEEAFREACTGGHFETAKWLVSLGEIDIHAVEDEAFVMSCVYGYLEIAQWLFFLGGIDMNAQCGIVFEKETEYDTVCRQKERQEVLKWLEEIK